MVPLFSSSSNEFSSPLNSGTGKFLRKWGTINKSYVVEPYVTGYHFIKFINFPKIQSNSGSLPQNPKNFLEASCLAVTLPGATMNKAEVIGLGNIKYGVPTNADVDNTLTIRFLETQGVPIAKIITAWFNDIRHISLGISKMDDYNKANYSANLLYWTTRPDGKTIEYYACLAGVFPTRAPLDVFGHDLASYDKLEIDVEFHVDYIFPLEKWVKDKVLEAIDSYTSEGNIEKVKEGVVGNS